VRIILILLLLMFMSGCVVINKHTDVSVDVGFANIEAIKKE
jgi:uncharacterized protein YceK